MCVTVKAAQIMRVIKAITKHPPVLQNERGDFVDVEDIKGEEVVEFALYPVFPTFKTNSGKYTAYPF